MKTFLGNIAPLPGTDAKAHPIDVVFHLGRTRRFGGWANPEWTVLHHSMFTALCYMKAFGSDGSHAALLHDAHEYITGDIPTPVKKLLGEEQVKALESHLDNVVRTMLGISPPDREVAEHVRLCDFAALIVESFYFGEKALDVEHIGETGWPKLSDDVKRKVAAIVRAVDKSVYDSMLTNRHFNPDWTSRPAWSAA